VINRAELSAALRANRQALSVVDKHLRELSDPSFDDLLDQGRQAFCYGVVGSDGEAGIPLGTAFGPNNPYSGFIRMQSDADFVATRVLAVTSWVANNFEQFRPAASSIALGFQLYDVSSARNISLLGGDADYLPYTLAAPSAQYDNGIDLPAECNFPRNAVVRVDVIQDFDTATYNLDDVRVYFLLFGYKVFGG
jgi:hypothetical protein